MKRLSDALIRFPICCASITHLSDGTVSGLRPLSGVRRHTERMIAQVARTVAVFFSVINGLDAKLLKSLKGILHGLDRFRPMGSTV